MKREHGPFFVTELNTTMEDIARQFVEQGIEPIPKTNELNVRNRSKTNIPERVANSLSAIQDSPPQDGFLVSGLGAALRIAS